MKKLFSLPSFNKKKSQLTDQDSSAQAMRAANYDKLQPLSLDHEVAPVEQAPIRHVDPDGLGIVAPAPGFTDNK
ncbi:MAG TPA: hypothetical protein VN031_01570 [Candidatus Microsaccharimonas sp.]|nr:hypothetical protein [Candidatus Microsaccharimonas sp.]